jgi:imidazolonepropionase-like amidohydrolase
VYGPPISNGVLVVNQGKIVTVGTAGTTVPIDATTVDMSGKIIMPGIIDTH